MTDSVRNPRRWPWILACVMLFFGGIFGGFLLSGVGLVHVFNVPCPPLFRPSPGEIEGATRGPGVFPPRSQARPVALPRAGRMARVRGQVIVLARVETDGSVSRTELIRSSGFCPYDIEALKDVRRWRFAPARRLGEAFAAWAPVTIDFSPDPPPRRQPPRRDGVNI